MATQTTTQQLVQALAGPAQDIENALQQLLTQRAVSTAVGSQLDLLGRVVGQLRLGLDDTDYRRYLQARIATNNSTGTFEDMIKIAVLLANDQTGDEVFQLTNEGTATCVMWLLGVPTTASLAAIIALFLSQAVAAGVRIIVRWGQSAPSGWFKFDSGPGWDQGHLTGAIG
jgi:hypothetical protein